MEDIAPTIPHQIPTWLVPGGIVLTYQYATVFMAVFVVALLLLISVLWTRRVSTIPGRGQSVLELAVSALRDLVYASMGPKDGRTFLPLIGTIFLFVWTSNMMVLIPTAEIFKALTGRPDLMIPLGHHTLIIPGVQEPSRNVNFPWALGIMVFFTMHVAAVIRKGPARYFSEYFTPHLGTLKWPYQNFVMRVLMALVLAGVWGALGGLAAQISGANSLGLYIAAGIAGLAAFVWCLVRLPHEKRRIGVPNLLMFPLNIVGKIAEILSMSFRLFGNIFGGAVIIALLSGMVGYIGLPIVLQLFIGVFVGTVQAFVFSMLSLTYISVEIAEEHEEEEHETAAAKQEAAH